jgi:hypothetical protein
LSIIDISHGAVVKETPEEILKLIAECEDNWADQLLYLIILVIFRDQKYTCFKASIRL